MHNLVIFLVVEGSFIKIKNAPSNISYHIRDSLSQLIKGKALILLAEEGLANKIDKDNKNQNNEKFNQKHLLDRVNAFIGSLNLCE
jgi:hypothetical protein